jgi:hypothetical protein
VKKEWGDKDIDNVVQNIKNVLDYPNLLSVFRLDSREVHEIDIAILTALLKGRKPVIQIISFLKSKNLKNSFFGCYKSSPTNVFRKKIIILTFFVQLMPTRNHNCN